MSDVAATPAAAVEAPPALDAVVTMDAVTVIYGKNAALREVTTKLPTGAVGLLGPNGAGKSTMLKALLGFVKPTTGTMRVLGLDVATQPREIRARIGYMPESDGHIPGMNAVTFVAYCGELAGLPPVDSMQRAHEVLYYVGLGEARYRNIETYSTGMKQRIKLAQALVHDPDLLFLDEPTNGMDPKGRVATIGPIKELKGPAGRVFELRIKGNLPAFLDILQANALQYASTDEDVMRVFVPDGRGPKDLFALAAANNVQVRHLRPSVPTLEDVFVRALGEQ